MTRNHDAWTRVWAAEYGPRGRYGKRVAPALVDTAMLRAATARMGKEAVKGNGCAHAAGLLGKCSTLLADWPPKLKVNK